MGLSQHELKELDSSMAHFKTEFPDIRIYLEYSPGKREGCSATLSVSFRGDSLPEASQAVRKHFKFLGKSHVAKLTTKNTAYLRFSVNSDTPRREAITTLPPAKTDTNPFWREQD